MCDSDSDVQSSASDVPLAEFLHQNERIEDQADSILLEGQQALNKKENPKKNLVPQYVQNFTQKLKMFQKEQDQKYAEREEKQLATMAQQQATIDQLVKLLGQTTNANITGSTPLVPAAVSTSFINFKLAQFDPDDSPYSMTEWLEIASNSKDRCCVSDEDMIMKVGEALQNRAKNFFLHWKPKVRNWKNLVDDLTCSFPVIGTPYSRLFALCMTRSSEFKTLTAFCHKKLREIREMHEIEFPWPVIISIIEGCCDDNETKVAIRLRQPPTENALIILIGEQDNAKNLNRKDVKSDRMIRSSRYEPYMKDSARHLSKFLGSCFVCGKRGHRASECFNNFKNDKKPQVQDGGNKESNKTCSHCKKFGHTEDKCFFKIGFPKKRSVGTKETPNKI